MNDDLTEVSELVNTIELEEEDDGIVFERKPASNSGASVNEGFGATPLEDRFGRHLWVRTRMCFCPNSSATDCRFHPPTEKGWEQCPHLEAAKTDYRIKGRHLWARNPMYGKPLTEEEQIQRNKELASNEQLQEKVA